MCIKVMSAVVCMGNKICLYRFALQDLLIRFALQSLLPCSEHSYLSYGTEITQSTDIFISIYTICSIIEIVQKFQDRYDKYMTMISMSTQLNLILFYKKTLIAYHYAF